MSPVKRNENQSGGKVSETPKMTPQIKTATNSHLGGHKTEQGGLSTFALKHSLHCFTHHSKFGYMVFKPAND